MQWSKTKISHLVVIKKISVELWLLPPPWIRHFYKIITSGSNYARSFFSGSFRWVHDLSLGKFPAKTVTLTDFHCFGRRKQKKDHKNGCKYSFTNVQMLRYTFEDVFWNCWHKINYVCLLSVDFICRYAKRCRFQSSRRSPYLF